MKRGAIRIPGFVLSRELGKVVGMHFVRPLALFNLNRAILNASIPSFPPAPPVWTQPNVSHEVDIDAQWKEVLLVKENYNRKSWLDHFRVRMGYTSNKIEGNRFTEAEVRNFLN
jgi:hypothetical protein